jgi:hypothetical protein
LYKTEADASNKEHAIAVGTSDTNGKVVFLNGSNEEMKVQSGNYFIAELEAPEGYNVYGKVIPISVEVSYLDAFTNDTWVENAPKDGFASVTVTDTKLTNLTEEVRAHNNFAQRIPVIEERQANHERRIEALERRNPA